MLFVHTHEIIHSFPNLTKCDRLSPSPIHTTSFASRSDLLSLFLSPLLLQQKFTPVVIVFPALVPHLVVY